MEKKQPLLQVKNLRIEIPARKGVLVALDDVSFEVGKGEILGLVGESGAGKSMAGSAVIGLLTPPAHIVAGEIWLETERIDSLPLEEQEKIRGKRIGAIFQDPLTSLNPLFTVGEQLIDTIRVHTNLNEKQAKEKAIWLLEQTGIPAASKRLTHYPHQFSGGMRQRVVIALALCSDPQLIIADEPTTALDVSVQAQIIDLLKRLCKEKGTSVLLVTHDMGVIAETADRVAVMYAGKIVEIGMTQRILHHASHPYTIGLMGAIPRIEDHTGELLQIPGAMPRLTELPHGCAFHPRCPLADEICSKDKPPLRVGDDGIFCCWKDANGKTVFPKEAFTIRTLEDMPK